MKNTTQLNPEQFLTCKRKLTGKASSRFLLMASLTIVLSTCGGGGDGASGSIPGTEETEAEQIENVGQEIASGDTEATASVEQSPSAAVTEPVATEVDPALGQALEVDTEFDSAATTGFSALLLDDGSVQLNWVPAAFAESYQIFRNDQLVAETTEPQIIDQATVTGDNVYRVVALEDGSQSETIADGLNVELTEELIASLPAAVVATPETTNPTAVEPAVDNEAAEPAATSDSEPATDTVIVAPVLSLIHI